MKSDRELLELAAKAIGHEFVGDGEKWNPLESDEDADRLNTKLGINSIEMAAIVRQTLSECASSPEMKALDDDAFYRRSIVIAAAIVGESMN